MNYAKKAEQLRAERLEKERLEAERKAKEQQEAAEKQKQQAEQQKQKAEELLPLFKQFDGRQICGGRVALKAELANDYGRITGVRLKIAGGALSGLQSYPMGAPLLGAHYDPDAQKYGLVRYEMPPQTPQSGYSPVGKYATADELMLAVAEEVSKL